MRALHALSSLDPDGGASPEALRAMAAYSGWGGAADAFSEHPSGGWAEVHDELANLLTDEQYAMAAASTLTAFYTPQPVIAAILDTLREAGIGSGRKPDHVLEPGCGTGNFMRCVPDGMRIEFDGVEIDDVSAQIASAICEGAHVVNAPLEDCYVSSSSYDAVVGNVPYSNDISIEGQPIHDWFIMKAVDAVRPGGVVAVLTSRFTLDKASMATRRELAETAELVGCVRLPQETFDRQAGTQVISDVLVLRRRPERVTLPDEDLPEWCRTTNVGGAIVNSYISSHPECVVGEMKIGPGPFGPAPSIRSGLDAEGIGRAARLALASQGIGHVGDLHDGMAPALETPVCCVRPSSATSFEFLLGEDGALWFGDGETVEPVVAKGRGGLERARGMIALRDETRRLFRLERDAAASDQEVTDAISHLDASYEAYVARFGRLCERANVNALNPSQYQDMSLQGNLFNLEKVDSDHHFVAKADVLSKRVLQPAPPMPDHVEDPRDAIAVSLDRTGQVSPELVARLLDIEPDDVAGALGDAVCFDPDTGEAVLAERYLSGDVVGKLRHVEALIDEEVSRPERELRRAWDVELGFSGLAVPPEASNVMRELRRSGVWECALHPRTASRAIDVEAWLEPFNRTFSSVDLDSYAACLLPKALDELEGEGPLSALDEHGDEVWTNALIERLAIHSLSRARSGTRSGTNDMFLALLAIVRSSRVDAATLERVLAGALRNDAELSRAIGEVTDLEFPRRWWDIDGEAWNDLVRRAARLLLDDPALAEYLAHVSVTQKSERAETYRERVVHGVGYSRTVHEVGERKTFADAVSADGLREFRGRRARFAAANAAEPASAERIGELERLAARLREVSPAPIPDNLIVATLGSAWIPPAVIADFARDNFCDLSMSDAERRRLAVVHNELDGSWAVKYTTSGSSDGVLQKFGTSQRNPFDILTTALNGSPLTCTKPNPNDPDGKRVKDPEATAAAWEKRHAIEEAFSEWVWKDSARAKLLGAIYNERFNNLAPRDFDGSYLTLPGSSDIELRAHQKDAVARILQSDEGTLVAHVVGAGKTFTGIAACREAKRLGKATKPMVVVPNHLTEQWAADFLRLYPESKVLVMSKSDCYGRESARWFWARAAAGDWDAVICGQSRFSQLNVSQERREQYLNERVSELEESIRRAKDDGDDLTVKQVQGMKKRLEQRVGKLRDKPTVEGISFEDLGCDMLFIDEAHYFKNLAVAGMNVAGMSVAASGKCEDLLDKCQVLREEGKGANIVFATGTPVSNTMAELYNMQRYLAPDLLARQGVSAFSDWAKTFGQVVESVEARPEGSGFQVKQRFAKFHNLPELMSSFHCFADIVSAGQVNLKVPECETIVEAVPATDEQRAEVAELAERAEKIRAGNVDPTVDNMLKITSDGRKVALDPKLLYPDDPDVEPLVGGKVDRCARNVKRVLDETEAERGAQIVFCDTSTPASGGWNIYDDLKRRLVELGVDASLIAYASDAGNDPKRREALFDKVRKGEVRVLLGSTQTLGTGTNVQDRLAAIHDLDCPWRPSDLEQRLGRIQRQGNSYDHVRDFRYVSVGTFDSYLYQVVEKKQRFISQVFTDKSPLREVDDLDETVLSYAEIKQLATGDPSVAKRMSLENDIAQLRLSKQAHESQIVGIRRRIETTLRPAAELLARQATLLEADKSAMAAAADAPALVRVGGHAIADAREAVGALRAAASSVRCGQTQAIGTYRGLTVVAEMRYLGPSRDGGDYAPYVGLVTGNGAEAHMGKNPRPFPASDAGAHTVLRYMDAIIERDAKGSAALEGRDERAAEALGEAERAALAPFSGQGDLEAKLRELAQMDREREAAEAAARQAPAPGSATPQAMTRAAIACAARSDDGETTCGMGLRIRKPA